MPNKLDLYDIQGNIVKAYGRFQFTQARYIFYHVQDEDKGRAFIRALRKYVTNSSPWETSDFSQPVDRDNIPDAATNIAFTYTGLKHLGLPRKSLQSFPAEFAMGMKERWEILGDDDVSALVHWDPIWNGELSVDIWLSINGQTPEALEQRYQEICEILEQDEIKGGVQQLSGHVGGNPEYQEAGVLPGRTEHFGYIDGISEAYFKGTGSNPIKLIGGGKPTRLSPDTKEGWEPLETGEFILGYRDESQEYPVAPIPRLLSHNGTFMVYRKLHQNVAAFNQYTEEVGQHFPGGKDALAAKFVGRWKNGAPLTLFPTQAEADEFIAKLKKTRDQYYQAYQDDPQGKLTQALKQDYEKLRIQLVSFNFNHDLEGSRCPVGAHTRRINPRGALEIGKQVFDTPGALVNRRRILRRGLPYGKKVTDPSQDDGNHGVIFMALCVSIERQFEFLQQQWINYGNDFKLANDKDPLLGNHGKTPEGKGTGRMIIEGQKADAQGNNGRQPFICSNLTRFVETRGGDYFFIPSLTALRMIGEGIIDPT